MYYLYHIPGKKIGVTRDLNRQGNASTRLQRRRIRSSTY